MNGEQYNFNFEHPKKYPPHEITAGHESLLGESTEQLHSKLVALEQQIATHRRSSDTDSANELEEYAAIIRATIQFKSREPLENS